MSDGTTLIDMFAALSSFIVTLVTILVLRFYAPKIGLVDKPGGRKTHHGDVPVVGGIGMFIGISVGLGLLDQPIPYTGPLVVALWLMVMVGALDDRFHLSPWTRLPFQAIAAAIIVLGTDTQLISLGDPIGTGEIILPTWAGNTFAILLLMTYINAFNMLDGMDGLAGMAAAMGFAAFGYLAGSAGLVHSPRMASLVVAAVIAFLIFNAPLHGNHRLRCFMGDAGSTFLGLALGWIALRVTQSAGDRSAAPVTALWLSALPLYELFWTFMRRLARGKSPFSPDAEHFHHKMISGGFSVRAAFLMFALLTIALAFIGIWMERQNMPDYVSFCCLTITGVTVVYAMHRTEKIAKLVPLKLRRVDRPIDAAAVIGEPHKN